MVDVCAGFPGADVGRHCGMPSQTPGKAGRMPADPTPTPDPGWTDAPVVEGDEDEEQSDEGGDSDVQPDPARS